MDELEEFEAAIQNYSVEEASAAITKYVRWSPLLVQKGIEFMIKKKRGC